MRLIASAAALLFLFACSPTEESETSQQRKSEVEQAADTRPNILLIVADDLGYSELGAYGGEINTPAIDSLAENGIRHTSFYAHSNCSPTRAMLFSGMDSHVAGLGAMFRFEGPNQTGKPGYEGYLNQDTASLARLLQDSGYKTYMAGKWHLGVTPETLPAAEGFDRYFSQLHGGPRGSHFDLNGAKPGDTGAYFEDDVDRTATPVADDFFSSDFFTSKLIEYLDSEKEVDAPFFAYLAFSAPHIPVQAPDSYIDLYKGQYDEGYDLIRQRRFNTMQRLGLISKKVSLPVRRTPTVKPWDQLPQKEQHLSSRRMEAYAGAVDNLDDNVGRMLDYLSDTGQLENTLILFMSDNGAAGFNGWQSERLIERFNNADNSLENLGRKGSMMFYGPGWAAAGSTPFYLFKRHMTEGGLRVPFIVSGYGVEHRGLINHEVLTVRDVAPTLLEIAGISYPVGNYQGHKVLPQTGKSFAQQLQKTDQQFTVHDASETFGWELFKRRGVRKGDWKAIMLEAPFGNGQWQLYDLSVDPGESQDLAEQEPEKLLEMQEAWKTYAAENNVIISNGPLRWP